MSRNRGAKAGIAASTWPLRGSRAFRLASNTPKNTSLGTVPNAETIFAAGARLSGAKVYAVANLARDSHQL